MTESGTKMKESKPRIKKARKEPTRKGKGPDPNRITIPWGRGASEYRPGLFTKQYFEKHAEACAAVIGPLVEVPVLISLVNVALYFQLGFSFSLS